MPLFLISLLFNLRKIKGVAAMAQYLPSPAKFWREYIIIILVGVIGFGGWYYSSSKNNIQVRLNNSEFALNVSKSNRNILAQEIARIKVDLETLEDSNVELEEAVAASIIALEEKPTVVYVDKFRDPLPIECVDKFKWLRHEAIKLGKTQ